MRVLIQDSFGVKARMDCDVYSPNISSHLPHDMLAKIKYYVNCIENYRISGALAESYVV